MSETKKLRSELTKRGIEWSGYGDGYTEFLVRTGVDAKHYTVQPNVIGSLILTGLTHEQIIAATLVAGTCYDVCRDPNDFVCSECGAHMFIETDDTYTMMTSDENIIKRPNYCPNCGARVVGVRV